MVSYQERKTLFDFMRVLDRLQLLAVKERILLMGYINEEITKQFLSD